jgi:RimJ/RimL family protein N-acetyltransferase
MTMHVALLTAADAAQYRSLMLEAYERAADAFTSTRDERQAEPESFWLKRIADPTGLNAAFGAFEDGQLLGTVALELSRKPKTRHKGLVIGMYVAPRARGSGAGRALMQAMLAHAESTAGLLTLVLTVTEGNQPAIELYRRFGFEAFGTEPMAILTPDGFKGKVHMWRRLAGAPAA